MLLNIITPLSRPQNLMEMRYSIDRARIPSVDIYWIVVTDSTTVGDLLTPVTWDDTQYIAWASQSRGISGNPQRNKGIERLKEGYVYFLDDDNIIHPNILRDLEALLVANKGIIVDQIHKNGSKRLTARADNIKPCHIDTAQFLLPTYMLEGFTWSPFDYTADGHFFSQIYDKYSEEIEIINKPLSYYNYLR